MAENTGNGPGLHLVLGALWGTVTTASLGVLWLARARRQPGGVDGYLQRMHLPAFVSIALGNDGTDAGAAYARVRTHIADARNALTAGQRLSAASHLAAAMTEWRTAESLRAEVSGPPQLSAYLSDDAMRTNLELLKLQREFAPPSPGSISVRPPPPPGVPTR
jgi:hypothetical protein